MGRQRIGLAVKSGAVLVSDGAWGTFLQGKGLTPGECPELWCVTHANEVRDIARSYVDAGADMIESNSFGASRFKLEHYGLAARAAELNEAAAAISRSAAGDSCRVIASVGPTGKILMMGDVSEEQLYDAFKEQVCALERGGADAVCIETMSAIDEAGLAVRAAREHTNLEVICTFTFERTIDGQYRTMMGVGPSQMAEAMTAAGAHIIGTNCGNGVDRMVDIVREIRAAAPALAILVHANAGAPRIEGTRTVFPDTPDHMAAAVTDLVNAGAGVIGGCCGTTPTHIAALVKAVRALPRQK